RARDRHIGGAGEGYWHSRKPTRDAACSPEVRRPCYRKRWPVEQCPCNSQVFGGPSARGLQGPGSGGEWSVWLRELPAAFGRTPWRANISRQGFLRGADLFVGNWWGSVQLGPAFRITRPVAPDGEAR